MSRGRVRFGARDPFAGAGVVTEGCRAGVGQDGPSGPGAARTDIPIAVFQRTQCFESEFQRSQFFARHKRPATFSESVVQ